MITSKKVNWIVWRFEHELPELFAQLPRNNARYPDQRADYRRAILADLVSVMDNRNADTLISYIQGHKDEDAKQFLFGITGLPQTAVPANRPDKYECEDCGHEISKTEYDNGQGLCWHCSWGLNH